MEALPIVLSHREQPPSNFLALVKWCILWWVFWPCMVYPHSYRTPQHFNPSSILSATAVLIFLLHLVWSIAFSMLPVFILVMCLYHFLKSLSGCSIMSLRRVFLKWSTLQYSNLCSPPLDGPPWGPGHVCPHSCCCLLAGSWSYSVAWSPFFLPGERARSSSCFPTSLPKLKEHLLFTITQLDYMWLKPHYWPSDWKRRWG